MKRSFSWFLLFFLVVGASDLFAQTSFTQEQIQQQLLAQPPQAIVKVSQKLALNGIPDPIAVSFVNADLDGSGTFRFYVAFYTTEQTSGGFLRVFQLRNGVLVVAGDQDTSRPVGGYGAELVLMDVNGDGIPEIEVDSSSANGQDHTLSLFLWTGSALRDMVGDSVQNAGFADLDHNGTLALLVSQASGSGVDVFKLAGQSYQFFQSLPQNPTGIITPNGTVVLVRSFCKRVEPDQFPLSEIRRARASHFHDDHVVTFSFSGLKQVNGLPVDANQVDLSSIVISPHLSPLRTHVHREDGDRERKNQNDDGCREVREHGSVTVQIARRDLLGSLQQLQPEAPLQGGDHVQVNLNARLLDGRPVSAVFTVSIVDRHDER